MQIPATIVPAAPSSSGAAQVDDVALTQLQQIANVMGLGIAQQIIGAINGVKALGVAFNALAKAAMPLVIALGVLIVVLGAIAAVFKLWTSAIKALAALLQELWGWIKRVATAVWDLNVKIFNWLKTPVVAVVNATINVIRRLAQAAVDAAGRLYDLASEAVQSGVESFGEFEQSVTNVVTVLGKVGEDAVAARAALGENLRGMAFASRSTAAQIAEAAYEIASAGWDTVESVSEMTRGAVTLSEATLSGMQETALTLSATLNSFEMDASQTMRVVNAMTAAIAKSPLTMSKMTSALRYAGASAHQFGMSLEGTIAAIATMSKAGMSGSQLGTGLRQIFSSLVRIGPQGEGLLKTLGLTKEMLDPAKHSILEIVKVWEGLSQRIGRKQTTSAIYQLLGARPGQAFAALLSGGSQKMMEFEKSITGTNAAVQMQRDQLNTLQGAWAQLKNMWTDAKMMIAEALVPAMREASGFLLEMAEAARSSGLMTFFGQVLGYGLQQVTALARQLAPAVFQALGQALSLLPEVFTAIAKGAAQAVPLLVQFLAGLPGIIAIFVRETLPALINFGLTALPVLLKLASIVLPFLAQAIKGIAGALTQFLVENSGNVVKWFTDFTNFVLSLIGQLPTLLPLINQLVTFFMAWVPYLMETAVNLLPRFFEVLYALEPVLASLVGNWLTLFVDSLQKIGPLLTDLINGPLTNLAIFVNTNMGNIRNILNEVIGLIRQFGQIMSDAFKGLAGGEGLKPLVDMLKELGKNLPDIVLGLLKMAGALITIKEWEMRWQIFKLKMMLPFSIDMWNNMSAMTNQIKEGAQAGRDAIDKMIGGIEAGKAARENLPGRASGGPVTAGQSYMVGEHGPERFAPNQSGTIIPNRMAELFPEGGRDSNVMGGLKVLALGANILRQIARAVDILDIQGGEGRAAARAELVKFWNNARVGWDVLMRDLAAKSAPAIEAVPQQVVSAIDNFARVINQSVSPQAISAAEGKRQFDLLRGPGPDSHPLPAGMQRTVDAKTGKVTMTPVRPNDWGPSLADRLAAMGRRALEDAGWNSKEAQDKRTAALRQQYNRLHGTGSGLQLAPSSGNNMGGNFGTTLVLQFSNLDDMHGVANGAIGNWKKEQEKMQRLRGPGHGPVARQQATEPGSRWNY